MKGFSRLKQYFETMHSTFSHNDITRLNYFNTAQQNSLFRTHGKYCAKKPSILDLT